MRARPLPLSPFRRVMAVVVLLHLGVVLAAAASPGLHERLHADAKDAHHECAITLFASGAVQHGAGPVVVVAPVRVPSVAELVAGGLWFESASRRTGILEHAPPRGA